MNIRKLAVSLLAEYELGGKYVNLSLSSHMLDSLSREERAALTALLYTTVERKLTYDYYISALSKRAAEDIEPHTRNLLRIGLCQIADMASIPDFAAVNETVKLARNPGERSFVNGVLRAAVRAKESLPLPDKDKNYRRYLSVKYSFPLPLVKLFDSILGKDGTEALLSYYNTEKYTDLAVNTLKISVKDYLVLLKERGIEASVDEITGISVRIPHSVNPEYLPGFSDGLFFVQDRACTISAFALAPKPGETVIDVCACPGGKSFAAAIIMGDGGNISSYDLHESKLSLIESGAERLGVKSLTAMQCDARTPKEELFGKADRVICDVPCSGLGVLSKKPDLRYKSEESIAALPSLQLEILCESAKYLKVGGTLIYSTCTLNTAENEDVVNDFLSQNHGYATEDFSVGELCSKAGALTLYPHISKTDGFFIAKIKREK